MSRTEIQLPTPEGPARAFTFKPDQGTGPWPGAIFFMDAPAIRPALFDMGQRLADAGYYVIMPDMFWRAGPYKPIVIAEALKDEASRRAAFGAMASTTNPEKAMSDTRACLDFLAAQPAVKGDKVGVTGYCMGGGLALRAAGTFPDRVAAAGAFHGGNMATDAPDSPHLLAPKVKAKMFVGGADEDRSFDEAQKERLEAALKDAGVDAEVTIYRGAKHGYAPADMPAYDPAAAERHWRDLIALFDSVLK